MHLTVAILPTDGPRRLQNNSLALSDLSNSYSAKRFGRDRLLPADRSRRVYITSTYDFWAHQRAQDEFESKWVKTIFRDRQLPANRCRCVYLTSKCDFWALPASAMKLYENVWKVFIATSKCQQIVKHTLLTPRNSRSQ